MTQIYEQHGKDLNLKYRDVLSAQQCRFLETYTRMSYPEQSLESRKSLKLADIASIAGVSKSTVSFVLNGHAQKHRIPQHTVAKVQAVVERYNYKPNRYALALQSKVSKTIGVIIPDLVNIGFAATLKQLERMFRAQNYQLLIASSEDLIEQEKTVVQSLIERQVDLLLVASCMPDDSYYRGIQSSTPVIFFDRAINSDSIASITTDSISATRTLVSKLCTNQQECIYIGGQKELCASRERYQGYKQGLKDAQLALNPKHVFHRDYQSQSGYELMQEASVYLGRLPTCVFTASYSLLEGVLRFLSSNDLLGTPIKLATFDNYSVLDCLPLAIDSIEQDSLAIATALHDHANHLLVGHRVQMSSQLIPAKLHLRSPPSV